MRIFRWNGVQEQYYIFLDHKNTMLCLSYYNCFKGHRPYKKDIDYLLDENT